jgi:hypothetical protein
MVFCCFTMKNFDNENDLLSFISLAALTANVVRHLGLDEKADEQSPRDPNPSDSHKQADEDKRRYIEHRLKSIASWEKKISGK